jgi:hypothetical protein
MSRAAGPARPPIRRHKASLRQMRSPPGSASVRPIASPLSTTSGARCKHLRPGSPCGLEDVCDPRRLALLVYDMQVGIVEHVPDPQATIARVKQVLAAARECRVRTVFGRHMLELIGVSHLRTATAWQQLNPVADARVPVPARLAGFQLVPELQPLAGEAVFDKLGHDSGWPLDCLRPAGPRRLGRQESHDQPSAQHWRPCPTAGEQGRSELVHPWAPRSSLIFLLELTRRLEIAHPVLVGRQKPTMGCPPVPAHVLRGLSAARPAHQGMRCSAPARQPPRTRKSRLGRSGVRLGSARDAARPSARGRGDALEQAQRPGQAVHPPITRAGPGSKRPWPVRAGPGPRPARARG